MPARITPKKERRANGVYWVVSLGKKHTGGIRQRRYFANRLLKPHVWVQILIGRQPAEDVADFVGELEGESRPEPAFYLQFHLHLTRRASL